MLQNLSGFQERPQKLQEKVFGQLFEAAEIAKLKPKEMKMYDESLKVYRDNENTMEYAKKMAREEGLKEGREEGREEGIAKGREEGREIGREEGMEKGREVERIEIAKMLKKNGFAIDLIAKSTGLSREQIEQLDA